MNKNKKEILDETYKMMEENGYELVNLDSLIMIEKPKMAPYIDQMRKNIAEDLKTDIDNINVKATTTEKLGFAGRKEGIAVEACVLVHKV